MLKIDGKLIASELRDKLKKEVSVLKSKYNTIPGLTVILVGEDPASKIYVKNKENGNILMEDEKKYAKFTVKLIYLKFTNLETKWLNWEQSIYVLDKVKYQDYLFENEKIKNSKIKHRNQKSNIEIKNISQIQINLKLSEYYST